MLRKKASAFKFKSSNKKIATVSKKGVIKAKSKKNASCKVTVTSKKKKKVKATIKVKVRKPVVPIPPAVTQAPPAPSASAPAPSAPATKAPATQAPATQAPATDIPVEPGEKLVTVNGKEVLCKSFPLDASKDYKVTAKRADGTTETVDLPLSMLPEILSKVTDPAGVYKKLSEVMTYNKTTPEGAVMKITTPDEADPTTKRVEVTNSLNDRLNGNFLVSVGQETSTVYSVRVAKEGSASGTHVLTVTDNGDDVLVSGSYNGRDFRASAPKDKSRVQVFLSEGDGTFLGQVIQNSEGGYDLDVEKERAVSRSVSVSTDSAVRPQPPVTPAPVTPVPEATENPNLVALTNSNIAAQGNLTTKDGGWTDKGVENEDGSLTFYTNAVSSGGGMQFYVDPEGKGAVDLSGYKAIKITARDDSEQPRQAVMELITGKAESFWSKECSSGVGPQYFSFGRNQATTMTIDLTKATNKNIQGIMFKYNGYNQPAAGATEDEQKACTAAFTICSIELVPDESAPVVTDTPVTPVPAATDVPDTPVPAVTDVPAPVSLDLSDKSLITKDGAGVSAEYSETEKSLDVAIPPF